MKEQPYTIPNVQMKRQEDKLKIKLTTKNPGPYQLLAGPKPTLASINKVIAESDKPQFIAILPVGALPTYFIIQGPDFRTNCFAERVLPLKNAINIRDLGGYQANDGHYLKWGVFYRGDQLSKLSQADIDLLEKYQLQTVVDYRSSHERKLNPDRNPASVHNVLNCDPHSSFSEAAADVVDLQGENEKLVKSLEDGEVPERYINGEGQNVVESYQQMVTSEAAQAAYKPFLHACLDPANLPLLNHCRGGKDRTGFGTMLLLLMLDIKDEEIIKDYMLTGVIRKDRNAFKYRQYQQLVQRQDYLDYLMAMIATREKYIKAAIAKIRELYGTSENYLQEHFDIKPDEIAAMRAQYLEEGVGK